MYPWVRQRTYPLNTSGSGRGRGRVGDSPEVLRERTPLGRAHRLKTGAEDGCRQETRSPEDPGALPRPQRTPSPPTWTHVPNPQTSETPATHKHRDTQTLRQSRHQGPDHRDVWGSPAGGGSLSRAAEGRGPSSATLLAPPLLSGRTRKARRGRPPRSRGTSRRRRGLWCEPGGLRVSGVLPL